MCGRLGRQPGDGDPAYPRIRRRRVHQRRCARCETEEAMTDAWGKLHVEVFRVERGLPLPHSRTCAPRLSLTGNTDLNAVGPSLTRLANHPFLRTPALSSSATGR